MKNSYFHYNFLKLKISDISNLRYLKSPNCAADHCAQSFLRLDNTGAWVIEVNPSLLSNRMSSNVGLYIK